MKDSLSFDTCPVYEICESLGPDYEPMKARAEAKRTIELLRKKFGEEPHRAHLGIKSNPHEFGSYLSIECYFDDEDDNSQQYCFSVESNWPNTWNDDKPINWKQHKFSSEE